MEPIDNEAFVQRVIDRQAKRKAEGERLAAESVPVGQPFDGAQMVRCDGKRYIRVRKHNAPQGVDVTAPDSYDIFLEILDIAGVADNCTEPDLSPR